MRAICNTPKNYPQSLAVLPGVHLVPKLSTVSSHKSLVHFRIKCTEGQSTPDARANRELAVSKQECSHWMEATSKELPANLRARVQCELGLIVTRCSAETTLKPIHSNLKHVYVFQSLFSILIFLRDPAAMESRFKKTLCVCLRACMRACVCVCVCVPLTEKHLVTQSKSEPHKGTGDLFSILVAVSAAECHRNILKPV